MKETYEKSSLATSRDTRNAISSPESQDGPTPCNWPDGTWTDLFGQAHVPVSRLVALVKDSARKTNATSGPSSHGLSASAALQQSLGSKLRMQLERAGSILHSMTWRERHTPAHRLYCEHLPSALHPKGKGSSGLLPTLTAREGRDWSRGRILASLDNGTGVAKRICALSQSDLLSEEICGLNPSFGGWMMGYPPEWYACAVSAMQSIQDLPHSSS